MTVSQDEFISLLGRTFGHNYTGFFNINSALSRVLMAG